MYVDFLECVHMCPDLGKTTKLSHFVFREILFWNIEAAVALLCCHIAMQYLLYSLLVFEIVFTATVISWVSHIRGGRGRGVLGVGGQAECEPSLPLSHNESLILGHNLDFSSCDILVSFCKPSHIYACMHLTNYVCIIKLKL